MKLNPILTLAAGVAAGVAGFLWYQQFSAQRLMTGAQPPSSPSSPDTSGFNPYAGLGDPNSFGIGNALNPSLTLSGGSSSFGINPDPNASPSASSGTFGVGNALPDPIFGGL